MIKSKTKREIEIMKEGGKILAGVLDSVIKKVKPGITTGELNEYAEELIDRSGGTASFKNYDAPWAPHPYPAALCISVNDEVVHGIPSERILKDGDIVGLDCGLEYKGLFTDMARTVAVGKVSKEAYKLIDTTQDALMAGIEALAPGIKLSEISKIIQDKVEKAGFSAVKQLVGHGVGYKAHEDPQIPNYVGGSFPEVILKSGMCLAIEPMVNVGGWEIETLEDGWTIVTKDGSLSGHFEHTVAITDEGYEILTQ